VIESKFIAVDGIVAGQKMMLTPTPFLLGAIVMGTNSCAVDTVGCHMVGLNPQNLTHLRYAAQRGHGPLTLGHIEVGGDYPLEAVQERTRNFKFCVERIDDYFSSSRRLNCSVGKFPEAHATQYCWGGCPGALQEAIHILRQFNSNADKQMHKLRYVVGQIDEPLDLDEDERVIFAGDCTRWQGKIDGKAVQIKAGYKSVSEVNVKKTASNDMLLKTVSALVHTLKKQSTRFIHARGCPVSVAQHVNYVSAVANIKNPIFDRRLLLPVILAYVQMRVFRFLNRFMP
jgi:hypothetical protein